MADEVTMYACEICGSLYKDAKTADACAAKGIYPGVQAFLPSPMEFNAKRVDIQVGRKYLAVRGGYHAAVPVTINSKFQSAYNAHETQYTAVKDDGKPLNLNGWYLVDVYPTEAE